MPYSASKITFRGITQGVAKEVAKHNINNSLPTQQVIRFAIPPFLAAIVIGFVVEEYSDFRKKITLGVKIKTRI